MLTTKENHMGCVLRAAGKRLDIDKYLKKSTFTNYNIYRKGAPRFTNKPKGKKNKTAGINIPISNGSFDNLNRQIISAIRFLNKHRTEIKRLVRFEGLDGAPVLDFGINKRNFPGQFDRFSSEIVSLAGKLGLAIELSQYDFGSIKTKKKR
jgi:hypothetical protein